MGKQKKGGKAKGAASVKQPKQPEVKMTDLKKKVLEYCFFREVETPAQIKEESKYLKIHLKQLGIKLDLRYKESWQRIIDENIHDRIQDIVLDDSQAYVRNVRENLKKELERIESLGSIFVKSLPSVGETAINVRATKIED